ncbi:MAG: type IX secretion system sortase PorU [Bacteroidia bacterium]
MKRHIVLNIFIAIIFTVPSYGQQTSHHRKLDWKIVPASERTESFLSFDLAIIDPAKSNQPLYVEKFPGINDEKAKVILRNDVYEEVKQIELIPYQNELHSQVEIEVHVGYQNKKPFLTVEFLPLRRNSLTGKIERLTEFDLELSYLNSSGTQQAGQASNKKSNTSVLATGEWFKIGVSATGLFKVTFEDLVNLGMNTSGMDPRNIRVYGNGGGMLPYRNSIPRIDDLEEIPVRVEGESDSRFDPSDYILFFAEGPHLWEFVDSTLSYNYQYNVFSDTAYYFITSSLGRGKRVPKVGPSPQGSQTVTSYDALFHHEVDKVSEINKEIKSGKRWVGEEFITQTSHEFDFTIPNLIKSEDILLKSRVLARSASNSSFIYRYGGQQILSSQVPPVNTSNYYADFAKETTDAAGFRATSDQINLNLQYIKSTSNSMGWLDYIQLQARATLSYSNSQMIFRDKQSYGGGSAEFIMSNADNSLRIWDVSDLHQVSEQTLNVNNNQASFSTDVSELKEFVAFRDVDAHRVSLAGKVANQDLHGLGHADMVIVAHPKFMAPAKELAAFHKSIDGFRIHLVTPQQIYNEFSSGAQDVTAIRDFMRMLYTNATSSSDEPRYLLLFGDGSYDYKNRITGNTNFVPTYQNDNITHPEGSYCTDDFFGFLDDPEGDLEHGKLTGIMLDVSIGRLPVVTEEQGWQMVNKIKNYVQSSTLGNWRNNLLFIADDEDIGGHVYDTEVITDSIQKDYKDYNVDKIYLDAYQQQSSAGGNRYPAVNEEINRQIDKGALLVNYVGHGGEVGLAHERIMEISDIQSWNNQSKLPLFVTATCEFSRFDDPDRVSAGELVLLNPLAGGIALLTTTRVAYSGSNFLLLQALFSQMFEPEPDGSMPTIGQLFRQTKNSSRVNFGFNFINFSLLGDPALKLLYPQEEVVTTRINESPVTSQADTLKALSLMTIEGEVRNSSGTLLPNFNGLLYPTVFDKPSNINTLQNDPRSPEITFQLQQDLIYKGKVSVSGGKFSFSFVVPKDISYENGLGKISYYAEDGKNDANGSYTNIVIGGTSDSAVTDNMPPQVELFINEDDFVFGGLTDENPLLIAKVSDDNGINTLGKSVGHDLTAILNDGEPVVMNEFYEAELDNHRAGEIRYPFSKLTEGRYTVRVKVWDVANNSAEGYTEFVVANSSKIALDHVLNYPNPFTTHTTFHFDHNQPGQSLLVQVQIFTISGKIVKTIETEAYSEGSHVSNIDWDGRDDFGNNIGRGVYVYKLKIRTPNGETAQKFEKLVVLK